MKSDVLTNQIYTLNTQTSRIVFSPDCFNLSIRLKEYSLLNKMFIS